MNQAIDDDYDEYFNGDGKQIVQNCFKAVLIQNKDNDFLMPPAFRTIVTSIFPRFEWPSNAYFGNGFKYLFELYTTNIKNNLNVHAESRLKKFFKMRAYELNDMILRGIGNNQIMFDGSDITNAVKFAYHRKDHTRGNAIAYDKMRLLLEELYDVGALFMPDDEFNIRAYTQYHWFHSIRFWLNIQRDIHRFHLAYADLNREWNQFRKFPLLFQRPDFPPPPEITNFTVIPMCTYQRRHIRIDTDVLYNILCGINEIPLKVGVPNKKGKSKMIHITSNEFHLNMTGSWNLFFDMDKIKDLVKDKKQFGHQIVSDGVSVTILYDRVQQETVQIDDDEIRRRYNAGEFAYELGIDPGMRTWNAAVRYDFRTGEEVIFKKSNFYIYEYNIFFVFTICVNFYLCELSYEYLGIF